MRSPLWFFSLCFALSILQSAGQAQTSARADALVRAQAANFEGSVSLFAKNLDTGLTYQLLGDEPVRTASTIKLAVMVECFFEVSEGKLDWKQPITVTADEKVSGSGILTELSDGVQLPIRDLMHLMIVLSDNTATNLVLNRITGNAVNDRMNGLGLVNTRVMRKILGDGKDLKPTPSGITVEGAKPENKRWGIGRTSPHEMVTILEKLYHHQLVSPAASDEMIAVLKRQHYHDGIGRDMQDATIASKSGALDALRSDVGIVYSKNGPIAMAITVDKMPQPNWTDDNPGDLLISRLSEILVKELGTTK